MSAGRGDGPAAPRIVVVRTSAMGDIVHCLPVLSALRRGLPEARIAWVIEESFAPLLADHPDIDELIPVRLRAWRKGLFAARGEILAARRALRRFAPDIALDLMGNHKGGAIAWLSGARRVIGAAAGDRRERSSRLWIGEPVATGSGHAVDRALAHLAALGLPTADADFAGDRVMTRQPAAAGELLEGLDRRLVLIQAGAGWANKTYPPERWGEVARRLADEEGVAVWVPTAPGEEDLAQRIVDAAGGAARLVDALGLDVLAALLRRAVLLLGGDTGPLHLAHALGTPVLCLIGPTDPERNGPYGAPDRVLWHPMPCSKCYKRFAEAKACLLDIAPREIVARARELLAEGPARTEPVG